ncbi:hypothetical protein [Actinoplanes subglobosus]|uniref:Uncharacterized protein n=1 Tax=Actinoplanes subglobosus TaxID=1547892 RepID=A0ABV8IXT3_9ACTN
MGTRGFYADLAATYYRAWTRAGLSGLVRDAGLRDARRTTAAATGFFQPMMIATG